MHSAAVAPACFPVDALAFALAWADAAPGGWSMAVDAADDGSEAVWICPPGCDDPVFGIALEDGAAETTRICRGGNMEEHGSHATLADAVLALCPLSDAQMAEVRKVLGEAQRPV